MGANISKGLVSRAPSSKRAADPTSAAGLDAAGGLQRDAVKLEDSLDKAVEWLQISATQQADKMQSALAAKPDYDKIRANQRRKLQEEIAANRAAQEKRQSKSAKPVTGRNKVAPVQEASAAVPAKPANLSPLQLRLKTAATTAPKTKVPAWRENVMKSKLNLFYSTQMARGYFKMKDKQAAEALDEASIGLILSQTMGPLAVQMLPLLEMQAPLQACQRPGRSVPEILDIVAQANAALKGLPSKTALVSARAKSVADSRLTTKKVPPRNKSSLPPVMSPKGRVQRGSNTPVVVPEVQETVPVTRAQAAEQVATTAAAVTARLQMFANQANGRWIGACNMNPPFVYNSTTNRTLRSDYRLRLPQLNEMLAAGQLVVQFVDTGEEVVGIDARGQAKRLPLAYCDLWEPIGHFFPHRLPIGDRIEGMTVIGRLILATIEAVIIAAGQNALAKLKVILHVDEAVLGKFLQHLLLQNLFGLNASNVMVVPLARFPGQLPVPGTTQTMRAAEANTARALAGPGFAMLSCGWPRYSFVLAEGKIAEGWQECESSPYSWAEGKGGTHLHTMLMSDLNLLRPFAMLDSTFLATALLEIADHKANMVMEVSPFSGTSTVPRSDREAFHRQQGSVVVAAPTGNFSYDAAMSDFASAQSQIKYNELMENSAGVPSCTHRYLFKLTDVKALITGPGSLFPKIMLDNCNAHAFLEYRIGDITSISGAKCVAVSAQDPNRVGPPLGAVPSTGTTAEEAAWLVDLVGMLKSQDNSYFYKKHSTALTCKAAPVVVKHRGGQVQSTVICLLVANNAASLKAMALAKQFMITEQHTMLVLHLVQNSAEQRIARTTWLSAFEDTSFGTRLEICCEIRGENNLTQAVSDFCDAKRVNLLITASVALSSGRESALMGSISLSIVRNITHVPILVFKSNSAGSAFRMTADQVADPQLGGRKMLKVMLETTTTAAVMIKWACQSLMKPTDQLLLARGKAYDDKHIVHMSSQRLFDTFKTQLNSVGYNNVVLRPHASTETQAFPSMAAKDQVDMLILQGPGFSSPTQKTVDLLRATASSVLIYRNPSS